MLIFIRTGAAFGVQQNKECYDSEHSGVPGAQKNFHRCNGTRQSA